jgi:hypothetical protein
MTVVHGLEIEDRMTLLERKGLTTITGGSMEACSVIASEARQVTLRVPPEVLDHVDAAVKSRLVRIPRHTWLLQAIVEKLEREASQLRSGHGTE